VSTRRRGIEGGGDAQVRAGQLDDRVVARLDIRPVHLRALALALRQQRRHVIRGDATHAQALLLRFKLLF
jgi:hypothetical protein